tara:strand:+ start:87 stop:542 length:456 start_codon:yes stop_codon:yes gene_type:complete
MVWTPIRKVDHSRRVEKKESTSSTKFIPGSIVSFSYGSKDRYDATPLVFVLSNMKKTVNGINLNYLKPDLVDRLLKEENLQKLKGWQYYKKAFRSYKVSDVGMSYEIEYLTEEKISRRRRDDIQEDKALENKVKDKQEDVSKQKRIERKSK